MIHFIYITIILVLLSILLFKVWQYRDEKDFLREYGNALYKEITDITRKYNKEVRKNEALEKKNKSLNEEIDYLRNNI